MVLVPDEQLTSVLRPVAFGALRAIEHLIPAGGVVPMSPLAHISDHLGARLRARAG